MFQGPRLPMEIPQQLTVGPQLFRAQVTLGRLPPAETESLLLFTLRDGEAHIVWQGPWWRE